MAKKERDYTADGYYLYIKAHNPYVAGVVGYSANNSIYSNSRK